jgi:cholera toxin transcriptional activator
MPDAPQPRRYRFGLFEADETTGELRRNGVRIKLNAQPFQVLTLLLAHPNQLLTRDHIARHLWPTETFVDFDHGLNSAVNRIREALGDTAANPRFIETLARRGYRFLAPVEVIQADIAQTDTPGTETIPPHTDTLTTPEPLTNTPAPSEPATPSPTAAPFTLLATTHDLPSTSRPVVQALFLSLQLMYVAFYVGALANLPEISDILSPLPHPTQVFIALIVTAALLIPARAYVLSASLMHPPAVREKLLRLWPWLLPFDILWSLSPFLLLHHINFGLALACTPLLVYSPFAQRSLILMGAGQSPTPMHNLLQ